MTGVEPRKYAWDCIVEGFAKALPDPAVKFPWSLGSRPCPFGVRINGLITKGPPDDWQPRGQRYRTLKNLTIEEWIALLCTQRLDEQNETAGTDKRNVKSARGRKSVHLHSMLDKLQRGTDVMIWLRRSSRQREGPCSLQGNQGGEVKLPCRTRSDASVLAIPQFPCEGARSFLSDRRPSSTLSFSSLCFWCSILGSDPCTLGFW